MKEIVSLTRPDRLLEEFPFLRYLMNIAARDVASNDVAALSYGSSWLQRGGSGAFMVTARKWDRIERFLSKHHWDIFAGVAADQRPEGLIDDIRDLRRYLMLWEAEMMARDLCPSELPKNEPESHDHDAAAGTQP